MSEAVSRREVLAALAGLLLAACGGGSGSSSKSSSSSATAPSSGASSTGGTTTAPATPPSSAIERRAGNADDHGSVLASDAAGYNGTWTGAWSVPSFGTSGTIAGAAIIDPEARTLTVDITVDGDLFHDGQPTPPFTVSGSVDSFTYAEDGTFSIQQRTSVGTASITSGAGIGSGEFNLRVTDIVGHPAVHNFEAKGVANRANQIPTTFTVTNQDGTTADGTIDFRH